MRVEARPLTMEVNTGAAVSIFFRVQKNRSSAADAIAAFQCDFKDPHRRAYVRHGPTDGQGHIWPAEQAFSVVKAWVGEIPRAPYVSTETIAYGTNSCDCG